jgi:predicted transcriptional regulator
MYASRKNLIRARESLGLRKVDFAKLVGVTQGYVTYIEDGRRDPSYSVMQRWLKALGPDATAELFEPVAEAPPWPNTAQMLRLSAVKA